MLTFPYCIHLRRVVTWCASGRYVLKCALEHVHTCFQTSQPWRLSTCKLRCHVTNQGTKRWRIIRARVVLVDWLHQAVQESSKGEEEKDIQPEETTTSQDAANVCSKTANAQVNVLAASVHCAKWRYPGSSDNLSLLSWTAQHAYCLISTGQWLSCWRWLRLQSRRRFSVDQVAWCCGTKRAVAGIVKHDGRRICACLGILLKFCAES